MNNSFLKKFNVISKKGLVISHPYQKIISNLHFQLSVNLENKKKKRITIAQSSLTLSCR